MGKISEALEKSSRGNLASVNKNNGIRVRPELTDHPENLKNVSAESEKAIRGSEKIPSISPTPSNLESVHNSLITIRDPESTESEQFRLLKNNILFPEKGTPPRSMMITSPSPNEGKSFVASNLAVSIAQSIDEYVLLMDCDLRSPTIHKIFGLNSSLGLTEHLNQGAPLSSLMIKSFVNKLTILPAGSIPANPSELLSSGQMRGLIQEVVHRYADRYIIIDAPPPFVTSEAAALARQVDAIILVIRHGKTRKKDVQNIIEIYGKEKIIGVVQNFAVKRPGYGYGYYKYGYGQ